MWITRLQKKQTVEKQYNFSATGGKKYLKKSLFHIVSLFYLFFCNFCQICQACKSNHIRILNLVLENFWPPRLSHFFSKSHFFFTFCHFWITFQNEIWQNLAKFGRKVIVETDVIRCLCRWVQRAEIDAWGSIVNVQMSRVMIHMTFKLHITRRAFVVKFATCQAHSERHLNTVHNASIPVAIFIVSSVKCHLPPLSKWGSITSARRGHSRGFP